MQSNQQSRPQINMPGRQQFVVANPAARQNSMVRTQSPPYAPAAQPMDILEAEVNYPAATSRRSYANTVRGLALGLYATAASMYHAC